MQKVSRNPEQHSNNAWKCPKILFYEFHIKFLISFSDELEVNEVFMFLDEGGIAE